MLLPPFQNLEGRLETTKKQQTKLQAEMSKSVQEATKQAETAARQRLDELIQQLQKELAEKSKLLSEQGARVEVCPCPLLLSRASSCLFFTLV